MKQTFLKTYESPKAEVIEIETQGVLCVSADGETSTGFSTTGGLQFGNGGRGSW